MGNNFEEKKLQELREKAADLPLAVMYSGSMVSEFYILKAPYMLILERCVRSPFSFEFTGSTPGYTVQRTMPGAEEFRMCKRPLHQHNFLEIIYVLEGSLRQHIEEQTCEYSAGQCCILNNHVKHCEEFSGDYYAAFLMLSDDFLRFLLKTDLMPDRAAGLGLREGPVLKFMSEMLNKNIHLNKTYLDFIPCGNTVTVLPRIRRLFDDIFQETKEFAAGSYLLTAGMILRLFSVLEDSALYSTKQVFLHDSRDNILFSNISRILERNDGRISRKELEEMTNYNGDYLNWIVRKHTGKNLTEYGQTFSLAKAEKMLTQTEMPVSAVIRELGFSNRSYFYRLFEQHYGMTPKSYREKYKNKQ